ncbi:hypothetical protein CERZMDRAFT_96892 [Cercospora zeae-maydis SCOH1-5]|uniref:Pentapeptide repeat-containing protein n=1 Tax=Cercospora zeae-maydis SCOH1-5 TaxID=717836 RepID=A0A6A6FID2_9PEZI|nr:hypothetical protein CERZMDRAFT_96892 [Cercospora zeae-maydis SCOH1-5]
MESWLSLSPPAISLCGRISATARTGESGGGSDFDDSDYSENDRLDDFAPASSISQHNTSRATVGNKSEIPSQLLENRDLVFKPAQPDHGLKIILGSSGRFQNVHFVNCTFENTTIFDNCALFNVTFNRCHFNRSQFVNSVICRLKRRVPLPKEFEIIGIEDVHFERFLCTNNVFRDEWQVLGKIRDGNTSLGRSLPEALARPQAHDWWVCSDVDEEDSNKTSAQHARGFQAMPKGVETYQQRRWRYAISHGASSLDVTFKGFRDDGLRFKEGSNELYTAVLFQDCIPNEVVFENCVVYGVSFENCNFQRTHFKDSVLIDCVFQNCTADGLL